MSAQASGIAGLMLAFCACNLPANAQNPVTVSAGNLVLHLNPNDATVEGLEIAGRKVPVRKGHPLLSVRDIVSGKDFVPLMGAIHAQGGEYVLDGVIEPLALDVRMALQSRSNVLSMTATLTNRRQTDRGLIVSMTLGLDDSAAFWSGDLDEEIRAGRGKLYGANLYPISAVRSENRDWALAAAIPPTHPVMFDTHYADGDFGVYQYIGITPGTLSFPNRAEIAALFYAVDPHWGFRSALEKYYAAYPEFYKVRAEKSGAWCFHMDPTKEKNASDCTFYEAGGQEMAPVPGYENLPGAGYESHGYFTSTAWTPQEWADRNSVPDALKTGLFIFPYTIVGQRQIYLIPGSSLVKDYDQAMKVLDQWTIDKTIPYQNPGMANGFRSVKELKEIILNSGLKDDRGRYALLPRFYTGNTLTFPLNPNPRLFADRSEATIAKYTLDYYVPHLLDSLPAIKGIYVDSMGRWNNFLNYRRDHFAYAKYPLSVDLEGKPVIRNITSHYEFLEELGRRLHSQRRLLFANGVNDGGAKSRDGKTDYSASRSVSRFFLASLSDVAGTESGANTTLKRMDSLRVMMGPKPYATLAKSIAAGPAMETYFKRGVAMGIFTSLGDLFYSKAEGRDAADSLHATYLPLLRMIQEAGWQPVRGVLGAESVVSERFGARGRGPVFLTLYNEGPRSKVLQLTADREVLGGSLGTAFDQGAAREKIAARNGTMEITMKPGQLRVLRLDLMD